MAKTEKRKIGDIGEDVALKYLESKGFKIISKNYLRPWGELDLVARKGDRLHFFEIKTVSREPRSARLTPAQRGNQIRPEENMHEKKIRRVHRAIQTYLSENKIKKNVEWQLDLLCIYLDFSTRRATVEVFECISI